MIIADPFYVGSAWRDASFARAARAAWEAGGFDLVQSHERIPGCAIYRAGDGVHAEWLDIRRADAGPAERLGFALNAYHRYVCAAERDMFQHPALRTVICNSEMVRGEIERRFGVAREKLLVVYNGVDLEHFHPRVRARLRVQSRAELGLAESETLFLFVGSGFWRKGLDAAVAALAVSGDVSMRLAVVGEDRDRARYAAQIDAAGLGGRVYLVGGRDEVRPLYAAADCFLLPTRYDPFPNTALEALAMGLPVIVGRRCGAAEIVREGENGWTCDPAAAAGLGGLLRQAALRSRDNHMQAAARATAEGYGLEHMAAKLTQLYAALME